MKNNYFEDTWKFIRGDLSAIEFEKITFNEEFKALTDDETYLEIISNNYYNKDKTFLLKNKLKKYLTEKYPTQCHCIEIKDIGVISMGDESTELLKTINHKLDRGGPYWWLYLSKCDICAQYWLVAQEERQNDVFCIYRLSESQSNDILIDNKWPIIFDRYEFLLSMGYNAGKYVRFIDPINSSLRYTIIDLAKEKPGITLTEIIKLLNLERDVALMLSKEVIKEYKVKIELEQ